MTAADEAVSGTSTKKREGFNRMISDALAGHIDLIVTKSVSRFARNTVDTLTTVRQLKEKGVEVYFQKENIYTLDSKGELLITIMSSLAQEESRSISENVTWGQRKRMADGKVSLPYKHFLGYKKSADGRPEIVESEAVTVRLIYSMFLQGKTPGNIAAHLTENGIPTPAGKLVPWHGSAVSSILQNEKYSGNALLQKGYTVDFLTKRKKKNMGEIPQFFVENSHPGIVTPEVFDLTQAEIKRRKSNTGRQTGQHCFSSKILCGQCSVAFGSKVWHSNNKYRRTVWQCNSKFKNNAKCTAPHFSEDDIKHLFVEAFNRLQTNRSELTEDYNEIITALTDTSALGKSAAALAEECAVVMELIQKCVEGNARSAQDQEEYTQKYDGLVARYETAKAQLDGITDDIHSRRAKREAIKQFISTLDECGGTLTEFDEPLWYATVDTVTVGESIAAFTFKDGTVVNVEI